MWKIFLSKIPWKWFYLISQVFSTYICFDTFFLYPQQHRWRTKIPTKGNKVDLVPSMHRQWPVCREDHDLFSSLLDNAPNLLVGCVILKGIMISIPLAMNWQFVFPENYSIVFLSFLDSPPLMKYFALWVNFESKLCIK